MPKTKSKKRTHDKKKGGDIDNQKWYRIFQNRCQYPTKNPARYQEICCSETQQYMFPDREQNCEDNASKLNESSYLLPPSKQGLQDLSNYRVTQTNESNKNLTDQLLAAKERRRMNEEERGNTTYTRQFDVPIQDNRKSYKPQPNLFQRIFSRSTPETNDLNERNESLQSAADKTEDMANAASDFKSATSRLLTKGGSRKRRRGTSQKKRRHRTLKKKRRQSRKRGGWYVTNIDDKSFTASLQNRCKKANVEQNPEEYQRICCNKPVFSFMDPKQNRSEKCKRADQLIRQQDELSQSVHSPRSGIPIPKWEQNERDAWAAMEAAEQEEAEQEALKRELKLSKNKNKNKNYFNSAIEERKYNSQGITLRPLSNRITSPPVTAKKPL